MAKMPKFKIKLNMNIEAKDCIDAENSISNILPNAEITYLEQLNDKKQKGGEQ